MDRKEIARNIKKLRENSGYTQQQVADVLNVDRSTYAYYELGKILPSIETIYSLSRVFNVHYSELLGDERKERKKFTAQSSAYVIIRETEANGFKGEEDGKTAGDCERWENNAQTAGDF